MLTTSAKKLFSKSWAPAVVRLCPHHVLLVTKKPPAQVQPFVNLAGSVWTRGTSEQVPPRAALFYQHQVQATQVIVALKKKKKSHNLFPVNAGPQRGLKFDGKITNKGNVGRIESSCDKRHQGDYPARFPKSLPAFPPRPSRSWNRTGVLNKSETTFRKAR